MKQVDVFRKIRSHTFQPFRPIHNAVRLLQFRSFILYTNTAQTVVHPIFSYTTRSFGFYTHGYPSQAYLSGIG